MDLVGEVLLERYHIEKKIGEGGMGYVYRAKDSITGIDVAIKILKEDLSLKDTYLRRFQREIRSSSLVDHAGIVRILDEGEYRGNPFLVMEYVEGQNLRMWAKNKRRIIPLIIEKFERICEAIDAAHRCGIVHRDMKPENVLITYMGDVKIMDFGLARRVQETSMITSPGTFIGTVVYTSPEQASGKKIDHRCDVYSIGVMLFEMLTGKLPFKGEDPIGVLFQHIHNEPPSTMELNANVSPELDALVTKVLSKDPDQRPKNALELARMLRSVREPMLESTTISKDDISSIIPDVTSGESTVELPQRNSKSQEIPSGDIDVSFLLLELNNFNARTEAVDYPTVQKFLDEFHRCLEDAALMHKGKVIQTGGHRGFYLFRSIDSENQAYSAVDSAIRIQRAYEQLYETGPKLFPSIALNIGIETTILPAEMTSEENLPRLISQGKLYHTATLIQNLSKALRGNSILICGTTYDRAKEKVSGCLHKKMFVRGKVEPVFVYKIDWQESLAKIGA